MSPHEEPEHPGATPFGSILVVDDDDGNRDLLSRRLGRKGYEVASAEDGRRALQLVAGRTFDLILLDVMMPELSGLDVLRILRETHTPSSLSVIMATACDRSEEVVNALRLGANDYVTKPLDFPVVLARVQAQLAMRRAIDEAARLERQLAERNRELEALNARLEVANRRMGRDLRAAARVQGSFLPDRSPSLPGARCAWAYRPCEELAGDGLNAFGLGEGKSGLYVFDVCGHGVASALLSVSLSRVLSPPGDPSSVLGRGGPLSPAAVADHLNRMFPFDQSDQYFTLIYGVFDSASGEFRYVSAGHPGLARVPASGGVAVHDGRGYPVGLAAEPFVEQTIPLEPGDRLYLYSDGIPESMDPAGLAYGQGRMLDCLEGGRSADLAGSVRALVAEAVSWCGAPGPRDDVSVLALEVAARAHP